MQIEQPFDIKRLLGEAIRHQKALVVVPWIVQFLSMLDYITLRLDYYKELFEMLFELYIMTAECRITMRPLSILIIKLCLGWLFEQPNVPDDYFKYRQNRKLLSLSNCRINDIESLKSVHILIPDSLLKYFSNENMYVKQYEIESSNSIICSLEKLENKIKLNLSSKSCEVVNPMQVEPILESTLNSACPFLADFRVSIMPLKHSKTVSRTGRYRHITTKISDLNANTAIIANNSQEKLSDAFIHSQSSSVRKTVEFVIERTVSAVIKDFQIKVLLCSKKNAWDKVNNFKALDIEKLTQYMYSTFENSQHENNLKWMEDIPKSVERRVKVSNVAHVIFEYLKYILHSEKLFFIYNLMIK